MNPRHSNQKIHLGSLLHASIYLKYSIHLKYRTKFRIFVRNKCPIDKKAELDELKANYTQMIVTEKEKYMRNLGRKLANPETGQKKYWTTMKTILRKKHSV